MERETEGWKVSEGGEERQHKLIGSLSNKIRPGHYLSVRSLVNVSCVNDPSPRSSVSCSPI